MSKTIMVDDQRCLACKTCLIECALAHSEAASLAEAIGAGPLLQARMYIEPIGQFGTPLQCRHCQDAPCVMICPTQAIRRLGSDGPVLLDADRCIGCRYCLLVCPFGVIDLARDGKAMIKCDLCRERTQAGGEPACVAACPTKALKFVEMSEWLGQRRREAAELLSRSRARVETIIANGQKTP